MALTRLVKDEEAQEAHDFIVAVQRDQIDTKTPGFSYRLAAARDIVRHYQTQIRIPPERIQELATTTSPSADVRDYAALSDEELEAKVTQISDYPRKSG